MKENESHIINFNANDYALMKAKVLRWASRFNTFCMLDNHQYQVGHNSLECMVATGVKRELRCNAGNALEQLQSFSEQKNGWLFGHLGYELKAETEKLTGSPPDKNIFPDLYFFEPEYIIHLSSGHIRVEGNNPLPILEEIKASQPLTSTTFKPVALKSRFTREAYIETVASLLQHIHRGDCYEINFCQDFFAEDAVIDPVAVYKELTEISPNPFSALYKLKDKWLLCASPERFLKKENNRILSQPIKGTLKKISTSFENEVKERNILLNSEKDRSENVMVVDLVRNDLSKICKKGSVVVDELFGIYSFPQLHQMISTISGELKEEITLSHILTATFPMASMTGAPKKRVMELINQYERTKRGIYSGALGYIAPNGDFDFNVVIRSMLYDATAKYLSLPVGSGITIRSNPEHEWEECLLKAKAMREVLGDVIVG